MKKTKREGKIEQIDFGWDQPWERSPLAEPRLSDILTEEDSLEAWHNRRAADERENQAFFATARARLYVSKTKKSVFAPPPRKITTASYSFWDLNILTKAFIKLFSASMP